MADYSAKVQTNVPNPQAPSERTFSKLEEANRAGQAAIGTGAIVGAGISSDLIKEAGKETIDAAKGFLESGLDSEVKRTVDSYKNSLNLDASVTKYNLMQAGLLGDQTPADVQKVKDEIGKYQSAVDQGVMTKEQALLKIDTVVKEYSNRMPGFAKDFRELAAPSDKSVSLLAAAYNDTNNKRLANKLQDLQIKQINMFVEKYGYLPRGGLNGPDMGAFREELGLQARATDLKNRTEVQNASVQLIEPVVTDYVNTKLAGGIMQLNAQLQGIVTKVDPKSGKPYTPESKIILRQQTLADVNTFFEGLKADLSSFNSNQISNGTREQHMSRIQKQQSDMVTALQNQDNFDDFKKTMELESGKAKNVMDKWSIANPHLRIMHDSGLLTPDLAKLWIDSQRNPQRATEFRRSYGNYIDDYYKNLSNGGQAPYDNFVNNANKLTLDPAHLEAVKVTDPGQYAVQLHNVKDTIKTIAIEGWGQDAATQDKRKAGMPSWTNAFATQMDISKPDQVAEFTKTMSDPRVAKRIMELDPAAQLVATNPIVQKARLMLENPEFGLFKRLMNIQESMSGSMTGKNFEIAIDPLTKQFTTVPTAQPPRGTNPTLSHFVEVIPPEWRSLGEITTVLDQINNAVTILENFKGVEGVMPKELVSRGIANDYNSKYQAGYFAMSYAERNKALAGADAVIKGQSPTQTANTGGSEAKKVGAGVTMSEEDELHNSLQEYLAIPASVKALDKELKNTKLDDKQRQVLEDERKNLLSIDVKKILDNLNRLDEIRRTAAEAEANKNKTK